MQLDNSMISTYCQCQWQYALRYEWHRATLEKRVSTEVGTSTHAIFDTLLSGNPIGPTLLEQFERLATIASPDDQDSQREAEKAQMLFNSAVSALTNRYAVITASNGTTVIMQIDRPNGPNGEAIRYPKWTVKFLKPELAFQLPLSPSASESSHIYMGRMDCVVQDGNGNLWILELKTSSKANNILWRDKWRMDTQPRGYTWVLSQHTNLPIAGVIIIPIWIGPSRAEMTQEIELLYTTQELEEWRKDTILIADEIEKSHFLPTGRYAGNCINSTLGRCDYFNFCRGSYREEVLMQSTSYDRWSPLGNQE